MSTLSFGPWQFDPSSGDLTGEQGQSRLRPQTAEVLRQLIEQSPEVVSREAIRARLWPGDVIVDYDTGINACIKQIRKALGPSADLIVTIPKKGFRLNCDTGSPIAGRPSGFRARVITGVLLLVAMGLIFLLRSQLEPPSTALAIMPIDSTSSDPKASALSQRLHNQLMLHLSGHSRIALVSARSVHSLRDDSLDTPTLGKRLKASLILEGQLRRLSHSSVLMLSLSDSTSGYVLWSQLLEIRDDFSESDTDIVLRAVRREIDLIQPDRTP